METPVFHLIQCVPKLIEVMEIVLDVMLDMLCKLENVILIITLNQLTFFVEDGIIMEFVLNVQIMLITIKICVLLLILFADHQTMECVFLVMLDIISKMEDVLLFHLMQDIKTLINTVLFGREQLADNVPKMHISMPIEYVLQLTPTVLVLETLENV
jgi:hypothetical protein